MDTPQLGSRRVVGSSSFVVLLTSESFVPDRGLDVVCKSTVWVSPLITETSGVPSRAVVIPGGDWKIGG
jgi:hypothetical protein